MYSFILLLAPREPAGGACPGRYLPVSTPSASGDQTTCEMPLAAQSGKISSSGARQSSEYCGWEETKLAFVAASIPASIWSGSHSLNPIQRTFPAATTSPSASIVSSIGTFASKRWHW